MAGANSIYKAKRAAALAADSSGEIVLSNDSSTYPIYVLVPFGRVSGIRMRVSASGTITNGSGGTSTFLPGIYYSAAATTNTTITSGNLVAGSASTALAASTTYPWFCVADLVWDGTSKVLGGRYEQYVGIASGYVTPAVVINLLSSIDLTVAKAGFNVGITMGTTRTGTSCQVSDFTLEVL